MQFDSRQIKAANWFVTRALAPEQVEMLALDFSSTTGGGSGKQMVRKRRMC